MLNSKVRQWHKRIYGLEIHVPLNAMRLGLSVNNKTKLSTSCNVDRSGKSSHLPALKEWRKVGVTIRQV